jgi:two-component system OmpR family response regulator
MHLLLLEDDSLLGDGLSGYLRTEGHHVDWHRCLGDVQAMSGPAYDLLLVDWQLPDGSGLDWVRALREKDVLTPVFMLTARDQLADRVLALDAGADDYLVKPIAPEELAARVRVAGRRLAGLGSAIVRCGDVHLNLAQKTAYHAGRWVDLTPSEWRMLEALATRSDRIVARVELERLVHGTESEVASNALEVHLSNVRRKLGRDIVRTVRGLGYRLNR